MMPIEEALEIVYKLANQNKLKPEDPLIRNNYPCHHTAIIEHEALKVVYDYLLRLRKNKSNSVK